MVLVGTPQNAIMMGPPDHRPGIAYGRLFVGHSQIQLSYCLDASDSDRGDIRRSSEANSESRCHD